MKLFHEAPREDAGAILRDGFSELADALRPGISVADVPPRLGRNRVLLEIATDLSHADLLPYAYNQHQWPPSGNAYREWRIPAELLNRYPRVVVLT